MATKTFFNPQHVRSVTLNESAKVCTIEPVRYSFADLDKSEMTFWHDHDPAKYAACVGAHAYFQKQRVQDRV